MERCTYRFAQQSDLQTLQTELRHEDWNRLSGLLEFSCTRPEWIVLGFADGALAGTLALATHTKFGVPLELFSFSIVNKSRSPLWMIHCAIEKAWSLGSRELFYTVSEDFAEAGIISDAGFRRWRKVLRLASAEPADSAVPGYQSAETRHLERAGIIALIEQTSRMSADSQIEFYRRRLGSKLDAEMTLEIMELTDYDPGWWRIALGPSGSPVGIVLPVLEFGEPAIGFMGVLPEYRGRKIASFLLTEAWTRMKPSGCSLLYADVDQQNVSMQRALTASGFTLQYRRQEWRLALSA